MPEGKKRVLIVCTGNVCRSPMAYGLLRHHLARHGLSERVEVETAGTYALDDQPPSRGAQVVLAQRGIDISHHRARTLTVDLLRAADLVIVMTEDHRRSIFYLAPASLRKVVLLSELVGEHQDIPDPYGGPREAYEATAALIEDYITRGLPNLLRRLGVEEESTDRA